MRIVPVVVVSALFLLLPVAACAEQSIAEWEAEGIALEKETGIPRLPLPKNIPPQDSPSKDLVHCTVSGAGRTGYVSIWLTAADCDAWLKLAADYNQKYGKTLAQFKARQEAQQNQNDEAKRQQEAGPGRRMIYALFLCFKDLGTCQLEGAPRVTFAGVTPAMTFNSLAECQGYAKRVTGLITPPREGRFMVANGMWYECRGKPVDSWERVQ
jgi:hypothetical protein